ncbi:PEP/pyruvate-binding domain-containing protein [Undibacterium sp.]|jgi:phosphohistidine swiveling domain-containing protein|uniref:PEP/pyruvate-binding domain-containing protein n=1 Tax=Undibacterium sp. TaxID=1914977 RepID=UPI002C441287|nr:PEP/pyruvate-binding domain-containing protein [Undibacterium sp.]HTD06474.1 PEP/pyruvate-binding domain-containing protein [Undibacterium sp.]
MSGLIFDWAAAAGAGPAQVGGKGWQLGRLAGFGVPVPPGFILGTAAAIGRKAGDPVPVEIAGLLAEEIKRRGWTQQPLAVRSSAAQEDSQQASFAGIHLSRLSVTGPDACARAVQEVWDSLHTPHAVAYRKRHGLSDSDTSMAVLIMPLLPAAASGVAFTCDPLSGRDDQLLIHAHWGLGEALVEGQVDGDEYRLQHDYRDDSFQLVQQRLGSKARVSMPAESGGTALRDLPSGMALQPVLRPAQALVLAGIVRDAACALDYAGRAYDVEWVWDGARYWIVQARPVTARGRHTYAALVGQPAQWSRGNTREILPEPLSALDWGLSRTMVNRMLTCGYALSGYVPLPGAQRAGLFDGRLYLETSLMQWEGYDALGVSPAEMNQLLGGRQGEISVPPATLGQRWARAARMVRYLQRSSSHRRDAEAAMRQAVQRCAGWMAQPLPADNAALAQQLRLQFAALRGADALFFLQGSGGGTLFKLVQVIDKYFPGEGHALTAALMAGGEPSVTAAQGYALLELARIAAADAQALEWLRRPDRLARDWAEALPAASPFRLAFADFLRLYGHRGVYETYLRNPSWQEEPAFLLDAVLALIGSDAASLRRRQQKAADEAWQKLRRALPFWLFPLVRMLVTTSIRESNHREAARSAVVAHLKVLRRGIRGLSARLSGPEGWTRPDDIFNLTEAEVVALAEGRLPASAAACRAAERRRQLDAWGEVREPDVVTEYGAAQADARAAGAAVQGRGKRDEEAGLIWRGTAVGSGCAQGSVHIARSPAEGLPMRAGDVLVAPSTDPAWTPLFLKAGALVIETGGYLSHGAIVAREFGIPAVVNLPGIVDRLAAGERVEVDGGRGIVRRLP